MLKVLRSSELAILAEKLPLDKQAQLYGVLFKLSEKGWEVLAPMSHLTGVLSKSSLGSRIIAGSKVGLAEFKKLKAVSDFLKAHPILKEGLLYIGDGLTFLSYAYEEYTNPKSPAYGDESKAIYGGINLFLWNAGPIEGAQYGGPVGAVLGTGNTIIKGNITIWPDKFLGFDLPGNEIKTPGLGSEKNKRDWLNKQYEKYGKTEARTTDKNYRVGVQPESGTKSFNPNVQKNSF